jgi:hypothetical protein
MTHVCAQNMHADISFCLSRDESSMRKLFCFCNNIQYQYIRLLLLLKVFQNPIRSLVLEETTSQILLL